MKVFISRPDKFSCLRILSAPPAAQGIYLRGSGAWRGPGIGGQVRF